MREDIFVGIWELGNPTLESDSLLYTYVCNTTELTATLRLSVTSSSSSPGALSDTFRQKKGENVPAIGDTYSGIEAGYSVLVQGLGPWALGTKYV